MASAQQATLRDHLFGMAAVELGLLTSQQVGECFMLQAQSGAPTSLPQICLEHGYVTRESVKRIVAFQQQLQRRFTAEASLFGRMAISLRLLTQEQVRVCLAKQTQAAYQKKLGEVCVEEGYLSEQDVQRILHEQQNLKQRMAAEIPLFGNIALDRRYLTRDQLDECIAEQREEGSLRRIGEICVQKGFLEPGQVKEILQLQAGMREQREPGSEWEADSRAPSQPGEPMINDLLRRMASMRASDLHLSAGCVAHIRVDGTMKAAGKVPVSDAELRSLLMEIIPKGPRRNFDEKCDADFAHEVEGLARFRVNYFVDRKGMGAVFRQIPYEIQRPEELGLPPAVVELCWLSKGLVLVTGPTASGKSTTLAALVDFINRKRTDHIVTIEDPIEFVHANKQCLVNQREVGTHTSSFKNALRAALREDPDVVLVGELRDLETMSIAIETAETGHLVFGTLHTTSAPTTVDRVIEQFPGNQQAQIRTMLSESLRGVIAQVLCKRIGGGRVAAFEVLLGTPAVANLIREGKTEQLISVMQMGRGLGMQTMNEHFLSLVAKGVVEPREAYLKSNDRRALKEQFDKRGIKLPLETTDELQFD